jgi:hypothetical protein
VAVRKRKAVGISRIPVPVSAADRKKPRFLSPPSFAPPVYPGAPSLIPHALLDAGLLGSQQELRSGGYGNVIDNFSSAGAP